MHEKNDRSRLYIWYTSLHNNITKCIRLKCFPVVVRFFLTPSGMIRDFLRLIQSKIRSQKALWLLYYFERWPKLLPDLSSNLIFLWKQKWAICLVTPPLQHRCNTKQGFENFQFIQMLRQDWQFGNQSLMCKHCREDWNWPPKKLMELPWKAFRNGTFICWVCVTLT